MKMHKFNHTESASLTQVQTQYRRLLREVTQMSKLEHGANMGTEVRSQGLGDHDLPLAMVSDGRQRVRHWQRAYKTFTAGYKSVYMYVIALTLPGADYAQLDAQYQRGALMTSRLWNHIRRQQQDNAIGAILANQIALNHSIFEMGLTPKLYAISGKIILVTEHELPVADCQALWDTDLKRQCQRQHIAKAASVTVTPIFDYVSQPIISRMESSSNDLIESAILSIQYPIDPLVWTEFTATDTMGETAEYQLKVFAELYKVLHSHHFRRTTGAWRQSVAPSQALS